MHKKFEMLEEREREITAEDIIRARASGDLEALNEASLGRMYQLFKKCREDALCIISAYRHEDDWETHKAKSKELAHMLDRGSWAFSS